jgi:hypothetical protein
MMRRRILLAIAAALVLWVVRDLAVPVRHDLRDFDPRAVARIETDMWRSYYDHRSVRLFSELTVLLRSQYGLPFWRSVAGAYYAARAAVVFQKGRERAEYDRALPALDRFYALIRAASASDFDAQRAARLELEWWIVHRQRAGHPPGDLERSLAQLQSAIYHLPPEQFAIHAKARADAMVIRDSRAAAGSVTADDWQQIAKLLEESWFGLRAAVEGGSPAAVIPAANGVSR